MLGRSSPPLTAEVGEEPTGGGGQHLNVRSSVVPGLSARRRISRPARADLSPPASAHALSGCFRFSQSRRALAECWAYYERVADLDDNAFTVVPLGPDTWDLFEGLAGRHNGVFGGCWCIYFHPDGPERGQGAQANRELKKRYVEQGKAHAALVVDGDEAIAWCEYGTPEELPTIHHRKQYEAECDALPDYRLTCIFVDRRYRRRGLAEAALRGALELIARAGGGVVEGYPHEISDKKMSSSFLYNGTRGLYERVGFEYVRPKGLRNCVMRRSVNPVNESD